MYFSKKVYIITGLRSLNKNGHFLKKYCSYDLLEIIKQKPTMYFTKKKTLLMA